MQVIVEQLTASPLNNLLFMIYYSLVVEGIHCDILSNMHMRLFYTYIYLIVQILLPVTTAYQEFFFHLHVSTSDEIIFIKFQGGHLNK
jgi:hypothetical protein